MALDYKNADKKMLKENLKNTIQGLLREGVYDEAAPVQPAGKKAYVSPTTTPAQPATQEVDKLASTYDYEQYIGLLNQMIQQADAKNMPLRQAIFNAFNNQNGGDIKMSLSNENVPVANLHPTQSEIDLSKSLAFPIAKDPGSVPQILGGQTCAPGGKQIITFNGQYVIDGHHRWSQVFCVNPNANISAVNIQCNEIKNPIDMLKATQSAIAAVKVAGGDNTPLPSQVAQKGLNIYELPIQQISTWISQNITDKAVSVFASSLGYTESAEHSDRQLMYNRMFNKNINEMNEGQGIPTQTQNKSKVVQYLSNNCNTLKTEHGPADGAPNRGLMPQTDDYFSEVESALSKGTDDVVIGKATSQQPEQQPAAQQNPNNYNTRYASNISTPTGNGLGNATPQNVPNQGQNVQQPKAVPQNMKNNQVQENKKNMKLTESQLKQVIQESVKRVLREMDEINKEYEDMKKAQAYDKYLGQNMLKRGLDIVTGKRPEKPFPYTPNEKMGVRAQRYVDAFNKEHGLGNRVDYPGGESYHSAMAWSDDPENRYEPVLKQTAYDGSTVAQQRKAFQDNGDYKEWGVEYPYSEFGYTGKYEGDNEDIKRRSAQFDKLRDKVSGDLAKSKRDRESKKKNESVVRLSASEFSKFLEESVKNVIKEMHDDYDSFNAGMDGNFTDRISRRYAEKAKYGYGNLDEGPWEDDGEMEQKRANIRGGRMDEYEGSWDTLEKNPDYNPGGMGPAYQKYGIPDDVLYGDR